MLVLWKRESAWSAEIVEVSGAPRPEWVDPILAALPRAHATSPAPDTQNPAWGEGIRELGDELQGEGRIMAAAFFRAVPSP